MIVFVVFSCNKKQEQNKTKKQKDVTNNNEEQASDDTSISKPVNTEGKRSSRKSKQDSGTSQS